MRADQQTLCSPTMKPDSIHLNIQHEYSQFHLAVDIDLPSQGVSAIYGPSGSGKTTLLRCIAGLTQAKHGQIYFQGQCWQSDNQFIPAYKRPIGYVFQEASLFPHLSAQANLNYAIKRAGQPQASKQVEHAKQLNHIIDLLGIGNCLERNPAQLSGGERQRVAIARALLIQPQLLLMDEPLSSLDRQRKKDILPYLQQLKTELDIPIIYVSHSADEIARLADYLVVMSQGKITSHGPLQQVLTQLSPPVNLGDDTGVVLDAEICEIDAKWHLAKAQFEGGLFWLRDHGHSVGEKVRLRILARDVSIALEENHQSSILNILPGTIVQIANDQSPASSLIKIAVGQQSLIAKLTQRSVAQLGLEEGKKVWAQIKSVALIE
tara:strand:+ start:6010 stop:7143 length:1134 start_codon:yes stop_codon:yes gene_type:complete